MKRHGSIVNKGKQSRGSTGRASLGWGGVNDAEHLHRWGSEGAGHRGNHDGQLSLGVTRLAAVEQSARAGPLRRAGAIQMMRGRAVLLRQEHQSRCENGGRRRYGG
jgi:hypothetical protein